MRLQDLYREKGNIVTQLLLCIIPLVVLLGAILNALGVGTIDRQGFMVLISIMLVWYCLVLIYNRRRKLINSAKIRILIDKGYEYDEVYKGFTRYDGKFLKLADIYKKSIKEIKQL